MTVAAATDKIRLLHVITGTDVGGAETMLSKLVSAHDRTQFDVRVVSLQPPGPIADRIMAMGVEVVSLRMRSAAAASLAAIALAKLIRAIRPSVVQTWMYHADLVGGIAARMAGAQRLAWNIRNGTLNRDESKRSTIMVVRALARLSHNLPRRIVCCSENARDLHATLGYSASKMQVIPNGFDLSVFRPEPSARRSVRNELGIDVNTALIELVARYDAQKDHGNFVAAADHVLSTRPDAHFLLCGTGVTAENTVLAALLAKTRRRDRFHLLGRRADISRLTASLDAAVCASHFGEAFPNVLGEAMACGIPCATTDVGDAAYIVGETGLIVPAKDSVALGNAILALLNTSEEERARLSHAARERVESRFDIRIVAKQYEELYREL